MGLLQPQGAMPPEQGAMPTEAAEAMPAEPMPEDQGAMDDGGDVQNDPAFVAAYEWMKEKLYGERAADSIVDIARSNANPMPFLVDMAYALTEQADAATDSQVMEENLVSLGTLALGEVLQVAVEAGAQLDPAAMANGLKEMVLRFLREVGADTSQLEQAMAQVSPEQINQLAQQAPGGV